ncbi:MAG: hypothetical protein IPK79_12995 [Vampirovibrionales bacterium]|nr:hypothetical protein [Vampirovibrionales bacterium]
MSDHLDVLRQMRQSQTQELALVEDIAPQKQCPFCAESILIDAIKCKHCEEWLIDQSNSGKKLYSNKQSLIFLFLLSFLSIGIYDLYWFYKNWRQLKSIGYKISPGLRLLGLFVPFLNLYLLDNFIREVKKLGDSVGNKTYPYPFLVGFCYIFSNIVSRYVIFHFGFWAPVYLQGKLNAYWDKTQPSLETRKFPTVWEWVFLIVLGLFWLLCIVGALVGGNN